MSQPATLSPSPIHFPRANAPSNFSRYNPAGAGSNARSSFSERRRTPHPHNSQSETPPEEMADRSQSQLRPRLEHRASQTVIDLTDDPEEPDDAPVAEPSRAPRPPQLGRSDAVNLGDMGYFIDLTGDGDTEVMVTGQRRIAPHRPSRAQRLPPRPPLRQADSPPLFVPPHFGPISAARPGGQARVGRPEVQPPPAVLGFGFGARLGAGVLAMVHNRLPQAIRLENAFWEQVQAAEHFPVPGVMNYAAAVVPPSKPDHVAPSPAGEGFTRSPAEDNEIICPNCEEELVHEHDKHIEEPNAKRNGKAPTRKDREEHPFWVVKECGHVYHPSTLYIVLLI